MEKQRKNLNEIEKFEKQKTGYYNVAVSDFDGTLAKTDKTVSEKTLSQIHSFISHGGKFAVCTGRMTASILPVCKKYCLGDYVISFQGAAINEVKSGKSVYFNPISPETVAKLCDFAKSANLNFQVYPDNGFTALLKTPETEFYSRITGVKYEVRQDIGEYFLRENKFTGKALFYVGDNDPQELLKRIKSVLSAGEATAFISNPRQIDVCAKGVSKGDGVKKFLNVIGGAKGAKYENEKIKLMCFGDEHNDLSMLKIADFSVSPESANLDVKAVVDYICPSNDDGGVGEALEKFGI